MTKIIGIAGGTGSGKTTLAINLYTKHIDVCELIHLDDYFKKAEEIPKLYGFVNYEDPLALKFDELYKDLADLKNGKSVIVRTKSELFNTTYTREKPTKIERVAQPKEVIILEGYMALYDDRINKLLDYRIYLDMPVNESSKRRSHTKDPVNPEYLEKVLKPMYEKFVLPTRSRADMVIDVVNETAEEIMARAELAIFPK